MQTQEKNAFILVCKDFFRLKPQFCNNIFGFNNNFSDELQYNVDKKLYQMLLCRFSSLKCLVIFNFFPPLD